LDPTIKTKIEDILLHKYHHTFLFKIQSYVTDTMSKATSTSAISAGVMNRELGPVSRQRAEWDRKNRRSAISPVPMDRAYALPVSKSIRYTGGRAVPSAVDILPLVVIPNLPASAYPSYVSYLTAYTLAAAAVDSPWLAEKIWTEEWEKMALVIVSARCGIWASTGEVPIGHAHSCAAALRWSKSLGKLIMRPIPECPDTALWRYFLGQAPPIAAHLMPAARELMWVAPIMLLITSSRLHRNSEVYAAAMMESVVKRYLSGSGQVSPYVSTNSPAIWDTLGAAATAGYTMQYLRSLAGDLIYTSAAQLRVATEGASRLQQQLEDAMAVDLGSAEEEESLSDNDSVADTEVGSPVRARAASLVATPRAASPAGSVSVEPPPMLDPADYDEITRQIRAGKPMTPAWRSVAAMPRVMESEVEF
jgi:hypothetical protein